MTESALIALTFEDEAAAERIGTRLQESHSAGTSLFDDAAIIIYQQHGKFIIKQGGNFVGADALGSSVWEFMIGAFLSGSGLGIDDWFVTQVRDQLRPGTSV